MIKKGLSIALVFVLALHIVLAQESAPTLMAEAGVQLGASPDSFAYKWGNFLDSVSYSFTFDKEAKAQKGLQIARKHLWEVKVFSEKQDLNRAQKAQDEYSKWISSVKENVQSLASDDPKEELEKNMRLNVELEKEEVLLEGVKSDIKASTKLSSEEKATANKILDKAVQNKEEVKKTIEAKREKAETKFKARFGLKEKELKDEVKKLEFEHKLSKKVKEDRLAEPENKDTQNGVKIEEKKKETQGFEVRQRIDSKEERKGREEKAMQEQKQKHGVLEQHIELKKDEKESREVKKQELREESKKEKQKGNGAYREEKETDKQERD